jgi:hypothetical protein
MLLAASGLALALTGQGAVETIPADWRAGDWQPLAAVSAEASATLGDQYVPARIHDGDRRTKWVSPTRPSPATPQWVTLTLSGAAPEVSAVAVFGEAVNNDGILDAEVQVATGDEFRTVATVQNATSGSWLATFAPVRASRIRLLITRSGGPTDHTDVWELEVYGRPPSPAETKAFLADRLNALRAQSEEAVTALKGVAAEPANWPKAGRRALEQLQGHVDRLVRGLADWEGLARNAQESLVNLAERATALAARLRERARRWAAAGNERTRERTQAVNDLRRRGHAAGPAFQQENGRVALGNDHVAVSVDLASGVWQGIWTSDRPVAIFGAGFSAEVGGTNLAVGEGVWSVRKGSDALGEAQEVVHTWRRNGLRVERELRVHLPEGVVTIGGRIVNESDRDQQLGALKLLEVGNSGWWLVGEPWEAPAAVWVQGNSLLRSRPFASAAEASSVSTRTYRSSGVLALASREPSAALVVGYVRADEAAPDWAAGFRLDEGGVSLSGVSRFLGRVLGPGETVELNRAYLCGGVDSFSLLEAYGQALAAFSPQPVRTGATSLWCSWYAHRMGMTEEKVLANAEVAARHFRPLGLEIMQLDHGWQRGDITGDWVPNERFPHGMRWLADQLRERHGLRLGLWIAPVDVAETSEVFRQHPEWLLRDEEPNPNCYVVDATHPAAYRYIVDTFRQLTDWGATYFKIDFIAAAGGEHFRQYDPKTTRGWSVLRRAMQAVREGAGDSAWIRYCQTPPVLSAGLANSAYGGDDTLDAGIPGRFDVLRDNALALAAGYWLNDRPYHREVCDMSVRMQGSVEEVRVRGALMALANCSISWSDELCYLPPSRIRLMQQCLPPGNPPMRPLDLFERDVPSVWQLRLTNQAESWQVIGWFNFHARPEPRAVNFGDAGLDPGAEYAVFEFWEEKFLGVHRGGIELTLPPQCSRVISLRKITGVPQLIGTDMHLLQGHHEISRLAWDAQHGVLSGRYRRAPGLQGKAFFLVPAGYSPRFDFPLSPAAARLTHLDGPLWMHEVQFTGTEFDWAIPFETPKPPAGKEPTGWCPAHGQDDSLTDAPPALPRGVEPKTLSLGTAQGWADHASQLAVDNSLHQEL